MLEFLIIIYVAEDGRLFLFDLILLAVGVLVVFLVTEISKFCLGCVILLIFRFILLCGRMDDDDLWDALFIRDFLSGKTKSPYYETVGTVFISKRELIADADSWEFLVGDISVYNPAFFKAILFRNLGTRAYLGIFIFLFSGQQWLVLPFEHDLHLSFLTLPLSPVCIL